MNKCLPIPAAAAMAIVLFLETAGALATGFLMVLLVAGLLTAPFITSPLNDSLFWQTKVLRQKLKSGKGLNPYFFQIILKIYIPFVRLSEKEEL